jgi:hypothetical protein
VTRVSLAAARPPLLAGAREARAMLEPRGAAVILGGSAAAGGLAAPIVPGAATLFGPRAACLASPAGPLYVSDTGHHRLLVWSARPGEDSAPADVVVGQPSFATEGRNAKGPVGAATLNVPTGIAAEGNVVAVADAWNHRVLLWHTPPTRDNQPADVVVGQRDFGAALPNRGAPTPTASTLNWCYGVAVVAGRLLVADTGNRRVLLWNTIPTRNGTPADCALGQRDFDTRDDNAGAEAGLVGMRWPHGLAVCGEALLVSDAGDNRVMVWRRTPTKSGAPCDFVLGQKDAGAADHNQACYYPTARALNMPYGLAVQGSRVVVADTANSRLLGFDAGSLSMNAEAVFVAGQSGFTEKGDNRWGVAGRDSLCWPYGVSAAGETLAIADAGNNRVLLWSALR